MNKDDNIKKVWIQEKVGREKGMETLLFFPRILGTMGGSNHMIFADESAWNKRSNDVIWVVIGVRDSIL